MPNGRETLYKRWRPEAREVWTRALSPERSLERVRLEGRAGRPKLRPESGVERARGREGQRKSGHHLTTKAGQGEPFVDALRSFI